MSIMNYPYYRNRMIYGIAWLIGGTVFMLIAFNPNDCEPYTESCAAQVTSIKTYGIMIWIGISGIMMLMLQMAYMNNKDKDKGKMK